MKMTIRSKFCSFVKHFKEHFKSETLLLKNRKISLHLTQEWLQIRLKHVPKVSNILIVSNELFLLDFISIISSQNQNSWSRDIFVT